MKNSKKRIIIKGVICDLLIFAMQFGNVSVSNAGPFKKLLNSVENPQPQVEISDKEILSASQLSYRAEGGFTGVQSFGVILSCVNGRVSVMKSIYDPRLAADRARTREIGTMSPDTYLALWNNLDRHALFKMTDAPLPTRDIEDEFTVHFYAKAGKMLHQFDVVGISRPEAARYFAVQRLIDGSVKMQALWGLHQNLAKKLDDSSLADNAN